MSSLKVNAKYIFSLPDLWLQHGLQSLSKELKKNTITPPFNVETCNKFAKFATNSCWRPAWNIWRRLSAIPERFSLESYFDLSLFLSQAKRDNFPILSYLYKIFYKRAPVHSVHPWSPFKRYEKSNWFYHPVIDLGFTLSTCGIARHKKTFDFNLEIESVFAAQMTITHTLLILLFHWLICLLKQIVGMINWQFYWVWNWGTHPILLRSLTTVRLR